MPPYVPGTGLQALVRCRARVRAGVVTRPFGTTNYTYLRHSYFQDVTTNAHIRVVINGVASTHLPAAAKAELINIIITQHAKRVFVVAVHAGLGMDVLYSIVSAGKRDLSLPLANIFIAVVSPHDLTTFRNSQHIIDVPQDFHPGVFDLDVTLRTILPIQYRQTDVLGQGVASFVYKAQIDMEYHNLPMTRATPNNQGLSRMFALKVFINQTHAERERQFLIDMSNRLTHPHIARSYSGFSHNQSNYLMSELGDKELRRFMLPGAAPQNQNLGHAWLRQQFIGLADALAQIHRPVNGHSAYHHDIKPDNIIVFYADHHILKFTDWGCANTKARPPPPGTPGTRSRGQQPHLPPETRNNRPSSRPHDIWSLGAVYLEILVWFLEQHYACRQFMQNVEDDDNLGGLNWYIAGTPVTTHVLAPTVTNKLDWLDNDRPFGAKIAHVARIIRHMLTVNEAGRPTAEQLRLDLRTVGHNW